MRLPATPSQPGMGYVEPDSVHNIISASVPAGAIAWSSPIQQGASTFTQTVTVPGTYRFYCSLHSSAAAANATFQSTSEMVGQFTVS